MKEFDLFVVPCLKHGKTCERKACLLTKGARDLIFKIVKPYPFGTVLHITVEPRPKKVDYRRKKWS